MNRFFAIVLVICAIFASALAALLYVSLIPHFGQIGNVAFLVLIIFLGCGTAIVLAFTWFLIRYLNNKSRMLIHGDVVVYRNRDGSFMHLSAEHVRAGVPLPAPPQVTVKELPPPKADEATVIELYNQGLTLRTIADSTGLSYYQVQKITSAQK